MKGKLTKEVLNSIKYLTTTENPVAPNLVAEHIQNQLLDENYSEQKAEEVSNAVYDLVSSLVDLSDEGYYL